MGASLWAVLGLLLVLSEIVVPQFVVFFFGLGALLNSALVLLIPGLAPRVPLQILIWAGTSGLSLALLRRYAARWFRGETRRPGGDTSDGAGTTAEVIKAITPEHPGRIRFRGTTWQARAFDESIPVGAVVTLLQKESLTYIVTAGDLLGDAADAPMDDISPGAPRDATPASAPDTRPDTPPSDKLKEDS